MAGFIKLTEKTSGRDKLCRVVQYGSKFVYWVLELGVGSPELVSKLKALEASISTARKCKVSLLIPHCTMSRCNSNKQCTRLCVFTIAFSSPSPSLPPPFSGTLSVAKL